MKPIRQLPQDVSSRIAAGEVIENPASAVKELIENSLDAGSSRIVIRLGNGGKSMISVEDDGNGIPFEELPLAIERFATSKIEDVKDLSRIDSFGYRGEALASICAVSRLEIRSFRPGSVQGGLLRAVGGEIILHEPVTAQSGTRIQVDDLFFNLPARRNFLKSASTEGRRAAAIIRDYAAAFSGTSFSIHRDGKEVFSTDGRQDKVSVLEKIWGSTSELRRNTVSEGGVIVEAVWSPSPGTRRRDVTVFFNGRRVRDAAVAAAAASGGDAASGNWMFFISVPPDLLDVNIHPGKTEVRVHSSLPLFVAVRRAVISLVEVNQFDPGLIASGKSLAGYRPRGADTGGTLSLRNEGDNNFSRVGEPPVPSGSIVQQEIQQDSGGAYIGQMGSGYLLFNGNEELIVVDPHAAHERIVYEKLSSKGRGNTSQIIPFPVQIPPTLSDRTVEFRESLESSGFGFDDRSGALFLVSLPEGSGSEHTTSPLEALRSWISILDDHEDGHTNIEPFADKACHSSVRLGERISPEEALRLFEELLACETPSMCPHGRPTLIRLRSRDLARLFGRES
ncbi:MAG: DNA mismatch repair endonuclease MutL [Thermovirgaceae bacterium]|nr:DNA mismatch repair endonuclease MutL [Thermovirgaceae bacterium]